MTRGKIRIAGIPLVAAGMASIFVVTTPDVLINRDGSILAINLGQGTVVMSPRRGKKFERDMWRRRLAVNEAPHWPGAGIGYGGRIGCDPSGCIVRFGAKTVALVADPATTAEDCGRVDHVILLTRLPRWMCGSDKVLVSTFSIWRHGAHAIRLTPLVRS
jgi:competence protein ComEC